MDKNFRVRLIVSITMFLVAVVSLYTFDSIPFKIIFGLWAVMSAVELLSFFKQKFSWKNVVLACLEIFCLVSATIFVAKIDLDHFWYIILGVPGYDIFAYLFGLAFGGKLFKNSRPFPKISKNKTWEGTILGLLSATLLVAVLINIRGAFASDYIYLLCGPLALIGDLLESLLKRSFKVKDSNEVVIKNSFFEKLEMLVGGSAGHGGFLDRIDSTAFTTTVLLIIGLIV